MVLKRMGDMLTATVHEGLDQLENPRIMLNQYLRDMEDELAKAKHTIARQETIAFGFERKKQEAKDYVERRRKQAQTAFDAEEEELARKALGQMKHYETKMMQYEELREKASSQVVELKEQLGELQEKFQALKDKKYALIARANAVKAKEQMHTSMSRIDSESAFRKFQRLEDRIAETEVRVNSWMGMDFGASGSNDYMKLEYADEVEKEMEKLRIGKNQGSQATS